MNDFSVFSTSSGSGVLPGPKSRSSFSAILPIDFGSSNWLTAKWALTVASDVRSASSGVIESSDCAYTEVAARNPLVRLRLLANSHELEAQFDPATFFGLLLRRIERVAADQK